MFIAAHGGTQFSAPEERNVNFVDRFNSIPNAVNGTIGVGTTFIALDA